ncbi:hypothetical protein ACLOJK_023432 [Asimina triloba]
MAVSNIVIQVPLSNLTDRRERGTILLLTLRCRSFKCVSLRLFLIVRPKRIHTTKVIVVCDEQFFEAEKEAHQVGVDGESGDVIPMHWDIRSAIFALWKPSGIGYLRAPSLLSSWVLSLPDFEIPLERWRLSSRVTSSLLTLPSAGFRQDGVGMRSFLKVIKPKATREEMELGRNKV